MNRMRYYDFWHLFFLANIDPKKFCGRDHLVLAVQRKGTRKKDGSTPTTTVSARAEIEKKHQYQKRNLEMEISIVTRNIAPEKILGMKANRVNDDVLQPGGTLARRINHDKQQWTMPEKGSGVSCKLCWWDSREKIIAQVKVWILCNLNPCVKHFAIFQTSLPLVEDREMIASFGKSRPIRGRKANIQIWKANNYQYV